jgi:8-oxo-dGTP pyrophosphatase MutT (NUDIX family)
MSVAEPDEAGAVELPGWLRPLTAGIDRTVGTGRPTPPEDARRSAVLLLLGPGPDLLLIERAQQLRHHAGQPAFPGGSVDPGDSGPVDAALREAAEEVGVDPDGVQVLGMLPALYIPASGFAVTPVVAWWRQPSPVRVVDAAEVARVVRVPVADLADPAHRVRVRHPSGRTGPGFEVAGMLVWGFTAGLIARLLVLGGWERPWVPGPPRQPWRIG